MSKKQEHNVPLSAELLQKYREGKLSAREMHRVERLVLENPFYADALEGLDRLGKDPSLSTHMDDLKERLHQRIGSHHKSVALHRTWQMAAAVALLILGGWAGYYFYFTGGEEQTKQMLSMQNEPPVSGESTPAPLKDEETKPEMQQAPDETAPAAQQLPLSSKQESDASADMPDVIADEVLEAEEQVSPAVKPDAATLPPLPSQQPAGMAGEAPDNQPALAVAKVPQENAGNAYRSTNQLKSVDAGAEVYGEGNTFYTLKGTVISGEDRSGLPGANVTVKNTSLGTVTDVHGNFNLTIPENQGEVVFSSIGFQTKEEKIDEHDSSLTVVLIPDVQALNEVVVTVYGEKEKKAVSGITEAKPVVGNASYKNYLQENLKYPQAAKANHIEGVVKVAFEVTPDGTLQKFSVEKPLGYGCDEEAIRLIREGPAWQPAQEGGKAIAQNVTVKVKFSAKD